MKTLNTTTTRNVTHSHERVRLALTLIGVVTAVLCGVALLWDARAAEHMDASRPHLLESYEIIGAELMGEVKAWM